MRGLLVRLYERRLERELSRAPLPRTLLLVIEAKELDGRGLRVLESFVGWCVDFGMHPIVSLSGDRPGLEEELSRALARFRRQWMTRDRAAGPDGAEPPQVTLVLGLSGREELLLAIRAILRKVRAGELRPDEIDDRTVEAHLRVRREPDMILRGGGRLTDFLIWQSIYSELYFTEVPWRAFRRVDFLRALRDYQKRKRRFGK